MTLNVAPSVALALRWNFEVGLGSARRRPCCADLDAMRARFAFLLRARLSDGEVHEVQSLPCEDPVERVCAGGWCCLSC